MQLVEHWHTVGDPSSVSRLAAIRALIELCQMDRAWARLRELLEEHPKWLMAHATAAELFLRRGWPKQARKPLAQALAINPQHPHLLDLQHRLLHPSESYEKLPEKPAITDLIGHAKFHLSNGSSVKGRALLNQIEKLHPQHPEVVQLVWACSGDYALNDASLWTHYAKQDHVFEGLVDLGDEPERTESAALTPEGPPPRDIGNPGHFADLFLHESDLRHETTHPGELTHSIKLASSDELERGADVDFVRLNLARDGDTQIRRVLNKSSDPSSGNTPQRIHANLPDDISGFNLDSFRREMGMGSDIASDYDDTDDIDPLEAEDAELIVLVRQKRPNRRTDDATSEILVPDPTTADLSEDITISDLDTTGENPPRPQSGGRTTHPKTPPVLPWIAVMGILVTVAGLIAAIYLW